LRSDRHGIAETETLLPDDAGDAVAETELATSAWARLHRVGHRRSRSRPVFCQANSTHVWRHYFLRVVHCWSSFLLANTCSPDAGGSLVITSSKCCTSGIGADNVPQQALVSTSPVWRQERSRWAAAARGDVVFHSRDIKPMSGSSSFYCRLSPTAILTSSTDSRSYFEVRNLASSARAPASMPAKP